MIMRIVCGFVAALLLSASFVQEITIPHTVLVAPKTVNYSRQATNGQGQVGTTVTIGYDAPWRQVHELLRDGGKQNERRAT